MDSNAQDIERDDGADKAGESADPGHPQPEAAEVESARMLANAAIEMLGARGEHGVDEEHLRRLADEFVASGGQGDVGTFIAWMRARDGGDGSDAT
jgi:hypothetical protein